MLPSGILICCTVLSEAVPFVYLASVCVSLVSNFLLAQAGAGGLLFRFAGSVQSCCGRAGAADRYRCVWTALTMFWPHWVCPAHGCLCFPAYTAQAPGCSIWSGPCAECGSSFRVLHKCADSTAPACCVFPGLSGSGSRRPGRPLPGAPFPSAAPVRATGWVLAACVCSLELASSRDPPGS